MKILLVDDDPLILALCKKMITSAGYEIETATTGKDGLEKAKGNKFDLILLDVLMPQMNGIEVLEQLKAQEQTKDIPVVMLTNLSEEEGKKQALEKGAIRYVLKSKLKTQQLTALIKELLEKTKFA